MNCGKHNCDHANTQGALAIDKAFGDRPLFALYPNSLPES
jgi:hypothetical protein